MTDDLKKQRGPVRAFTVIIHHHHMFVYTYLDLLLLWTEARKNGNEYVVYECGKLVTADIKAVIESTRADLIRQRFEEQHKQFMGEKTESGLYVPDAYAEESVLDQMTSKVEEEATA